MRTTNRSGGGGRKMRGVGDSNTVQIPGTYRGDPVTHHYNPTTGLNVVESPSGDFVSGWRLSPAQAGHVMTTGNLGGG